MKRAVAVVLLLLLSALGFAQKKPLTIQNIFGEGAITAGQPPENVRWSPDGTRVSFIQRGVGEDSERGELWYIDAATGKRAVLVAASKLATLAPPLSSIKDERQRTAIQRYGVAAYHWSPDSKYLLFDSRGQLWLYSLETGTALQLTASADPSISPSFSPDGKRIAYVRKHNLYVHPTGGDQEVELTNDAEDKELLNGEVDWVYAEELDVRSNYFWSPDSREIAFLQMDEKPVPTYPITDWLTLHPEVDKEKYPKAGDPNPAVRLGIIGAGGGRPRWLKLTDDKEVYIPRFGWLRPGVLWAMVMNRAQNQLDLYFIDTSTGKSRRVLRDTSDTWIEEHYDKFHVAKPGQFLWQSWRDGHSHLYLYSYDQRDPLAAEAHLERQLTTGEYEVSGVEGIDVTAGTVYFTSNQGDPRQRQLYQVKLDGSGLQPVTREPGTHDVTFPDTPKNFYLDNYSALMTPPRLVLCRLGGTCAEVWRARDLTAEFDLLTPQFVDFKAADGTTLYGLLLMPRNAAGKVPLIMNPYGGPTGQSVRNAWGAISLYDQLFAQHGFAVLKVDNRGMGNRGKKFAAASFHNLGPVELEDQLTALDQALARFPVLDRDRLGWWGWSYGGYLTCYALTHSTRFKAGVCGAPVTDWRLYDSIYTERYMGLPRDNAQAYERSAPAKAAATLSGRLLLAHGTSDDNVHMQNTIQMIEELLKAEKQFDLQLYPGKTHGVSGAHDRVQLYQRIFDHFEQYVMRAGAM